LGHLGEQQDAVVTSFQLWQHSIEELKLPATSKNIVVNVPPLIQKQKGVIANCLHRAKRGAFLMKQEAKRASPTN
tara:strand:+ start:546 stop:770 length:225 start_codon:yes stop_codon:yes gene_type:complete